MSITTTGNLGPMILQSLAPAMLYVPTPTMNYITVSIHAVNKSSLIELEIFHLMEDNNAQAKAA